MRIALAAGILLVGVAGCGRKDSPRSSVRKVPASRFPMQKGLEKKGLKAQT